MTDRERYRVALLDWLACAVRGGAEPAAQAARAAGDGLLERVVAAGAAGHVLDFDDTWEPGLVHLSAAVAPAALVVAAELEASVEDALSAYAAGVEAMAATASASHPALYERGWHATAVCGVVGSATATARLLGLDEAGERDAVAFAVLGAGGLRAAFGSDGKALQVGGAAATGVHAARLAHAGARAPREVTDGPAGFAAAYGGTLAKPTGEPAIRENWIKAYPCCLQTHSAIEAAEQVRASDAGVSAVSGDEPLIVAVHPISRRAAALDDVTDGLQAKFSIPYATAFTLLHGPPGVDDFRVVDAAARRLAAERVRVRTDAALSTSEARLLSGETLLSQVHAALGSPARPMDAAALRAKVRGLAGDRIEGLLDDPERPASDLLAAIAVNVR